MASLRVNYNGEKRQERERPFNYGIMTRNAGFMNSGFFPMPPRPPMAKRPSVEEPVPAKCDTSINPAIETEAAVLPVEDIALTPTTPIKLPVEESLPLKGDEAEQDVQTTPEPTLTDSEKFITRLETYETTAVKIRQQVDVTKGLFDDVLFHMDSFLKIMDVIRENQERKLNEPLVSVATQKTSKDTIDEVLDLLQTPALQNILRQVLMGVLVKK